MNTAAIILAAILADNLLLARLFGIESLFASNNRKTHTLIYGAVVTGVTVVAGGICVIVNNLVFAPLGIGYMSTYISAIITVSVICAMHIASQKLSEKLFGGMTKIMPLISTNCVVIGAVYFCTEKGLSLGGSFLYLLASGVGYTVALLIMSAVRERLETAEPPAPFKGLPVTLLALAFAAMAFAGFTGVGM